MQRPHPDTGCNNADGADLTFPCMVGGAAASCMPDHGRKLHELPWLYLDSLGQEYGPVPGWTMQEWLARGRFPVGGDLRVRLPEWERHIPVRKLYPDLSCAFLLPPAWPDLYGDGPPSGAEGPTAAGVEAGIRAAGASGGNPPPPHHSPGTCPGGVQDAAGAAMACLGWPAAQAVAAAPHMGANMQMCSFNAVPLVANVMVAGAAAAATATAPGAACPMGGARDMRAAMVPGDASSRGNHPSAAAAPGPGDGPPGPWQPTPSPGPQSSQQTLDRLLREGQLLPLPQPQPSARQMQEFLAQSRARMPTPDVLLMQPRVQQMQQQQQLQQNVQLQQNPLLGTERAAAPAHGLQMMSSPGASGSGLPAAGRGAGASWWAFAVPQQAPGGPQGTFPAAQRPPAAKVD